MIVPRRIRRGGFIKPADTEAIIDSALGILGGLGIKVRSRAMSGALGKIGYPEKGGRILIPPREARAFLEDLRRDQKRRKEIIDKKRSREEISGVLGSYALSLNNPLGGAAELLTAESAVRATKCASLIAEQFGGFSSFAPGEPQDVPAELASLVKYKISAEFGTGEIPAEPTSALSAEFIFRMSEVTGQPIRRLPVYPISPLCLGGDSAELVWRFCKKLDSFYVFSMPMLGVTAPLSVKYGLALCLAEILGCGFLLGRLTGLRCILRPNIFPSDMQVMNYGFGTPRKFLYECLSEDFAAQVFDMPIDYHSANIHTNCPVSGVQSAMEKTSLMTAGAAFGAAKFYCVGSLSLDEIFSPVELILDLLRLDQVKRIVSGFPMEKNEPPEDLLNEIRVFLDSGFTMSDRTLDDYGAYINYSPFINRNLRKAYSGGNNAEMLREAENLAAKLFCGDYPARTTPEQQAALEELYKAAKRRVDD